jgi:exodeoxyribonuclease X
MKVLLADTETTGTDHEKDEIIEAAWLHLPATIEEFCAVKNPEQFEFYHERFKPSIQISLGAMSVHNIIDEDLADCADSSAFGFPVEAEYLIGHNIDFDWKMMGEPDVRRICTLALSRHLFPELDSHKQAAMIYHIGTIYSRRPWARDLVKGAHAALDDVRMCAALLRFLVLFLRHKNVRLETWEDLALISDDARIPTVMSFGKHKGLRIEDVPSDYVRWYRGQVDKDEWLLKAFARAGK